MLGNHTPRQCGIATFTTDLNQAIASEFNSLDTFVLAMNDEGGVYDYPSPVRFQLADGDLASYRRAANFLNAGQVDILSIQHEYGIFGGPAGANLLSLMREARMPIVTTLHTVLQVPNPEQRTVMDEVAERSSRLVVMSRHGAKLLTEVHGVSPSKIDVIHHGIPKVPFHSDSKARLGFEGRPLILTFGLLSADKGIEYAIEALPAILKREPRAVYVVLGATHPHVLRHGDSYRQKLERLARELGVEQSVVFHNRFVSLDELTEFLSAADIYITPYLNAQQITSGTLAYAVGSGKAVISTPYVYAQELLAEGRGLLVPFRDSGAIAQQVISLLEDEPMRRTMRERARAHGETMQWPEVARQYIQTFARARRDHLAKRRARHTLARAARAQYELPDINLDQLRRLTDDTGLVQHACFEVPRYADGYCIDDNARALLLLATLEHAGELRGTALQPLMTRYLAFVFHAFDPALKRFRNFMSYSREFTERQGSEDSHGRTLWALGTVIGRSIFPSKKSVELELFRAALGPLASFSSPRAWAYGLLGMAEYLSAFGGDREVESVRLELAERLLSMHRTTSVDSWPWFESQLTYANPRMSQALIVSGVALKNSEMTAAGLRSLEWLASVQVNDAGAFSPVGSNGFFSRGDTMARFDQQPVEACGMVAACLDAHAASGDMKWLARMKVAFDWFFGANHLNASLVDPLSGGCRDALHEDRVNENQGAESTLSFLMALQHMRQSARSLVQLPVARPSRPNARIVAAETEA